MRGSFIGRDQELFWSRSVSANDLVKNFLGRPQNMTALQRWMGEEFEGAGDGSQSSVN